MDRWDVWTRVRLAEALTPEELAELIDALETPDGIALAREELERAREAREVVFAARRRMREWAEGRSLEGLRAGQRKRRDRVTMWSPKWAAGGMELERIIRVVERSERGVYRCGRDPGVR